MNENSKIILDYSLIFSNKEKKYKNSKHLYYYETISINQLLDFIHHRLDGGFNIECINLTGGTYYPFDGIRYTKDGKEYLFSTKYPAYSLDYLLYEFVIELLKSSPELLN